MTGVHQANISDFNQMPNDLYDYLSGHVKVVENMLSQMDEEVPTLMGVMMNHIMASGGKRTRPLLVLATSNLFGEIPPVAYALAASIELIHTATLLHDDVMDDADLRRHNETAHTRFGNIMSILFGDFLLAKSFQCMLVKEDHQVMRVISKACEAMTKGEIRQLTTRHQWQLSQEVYEQTIGEKTASLFSAACQLGGMSQNAEGSTIQHLQQLGEHIGMAFQIVDDIMDYSYANIGKSPGSDFFDGKITLPVILAVQQQVEIEFWKTIIYMGLKHHFCCRIFNNNPHIFLYLFF